MLTSVVHQTTVLILPHGIDLIHLCDDIFIMRKHIARLNIGRFVLLQEQESIADMEETVEDRLFLWIERHRDSRRVHDGGRRGLKRELSNNAVEAESMERNSGDLKTKQKE